MSQSLRQLFRDYVEHRGKFEGDSGAERVKNFAYASHQAGRLDTNVTVNKTVIRPTIQNVPSTIRVMLADPAELVNLAVRTLLAEDPQYSPPVTATTVVAAEQLGLSRRRREVLGELVAGQDNKSIAAALGIVEESVR